MASWRALQEEVTAYVVAIKFIEGVGMNVDDEWDWDCDKANDYFSIYNDEYTISFSYSELLEGDNVTADVMKHEA